MFARFSDTKLRQLGIDDQVLRVARAISDRAQLTAWSGVLPEDQFEVLEYLADGFSPDEVYEEVVSARRSVATTEESEGRWDAAIANTTDRIALISGPEERSV